MSKEFFARRHVRNWIGFALVILGLVVLNYNYPDRLDLVSDDDDLYFMFGLEYLNGNYRWLDDGALYCLWQLMIQLLTNDAVQTFYINWVLMTVLPVVGFYWLLRSMKVNTWVSVWVSLCYAFSLMNYPLTPKLTHFAIAILLAGLIVVRKMHGTEKKLFWGAFTILLASYVRPEMYVALIPMLLWLGWESYIRQSYKWLGAILAIVVLSGVLAGTPIRNNDRSVWTFKHHFSINYVEWYPETSLSPWNHFNEITAKAFGHPLTSPLDAFLTDPGLMMRHILFNIQNLAKESLFFLSEMFWGQLNPVFSFPYRGVFLLLVLIGLLWMMDYRQTWKYWVKSFRENAFWGAILFIVLVPSLLSTTIIYPRPHYILFQFLFWIPLIGLLVSGIRFRTVPRAFRLNRAAVAFTNFFFIALFLYPRFMEANIDQPTPNREFARLLQELDIEKDVRLFGGDAPFTYPRYVSPNWKDFFYFDIQRPENFARFVEEKGINCVIINPKMQAYFSEDASYQAFREAPQKSGFKLIRETPDHAIYVQEQLL